MKRWRIIQIGRTDVILHPAVILFLVYSMISGHLAYTLTAYLSIVLHEAAHGITATFLGQSPACIEITPLGAVMRLEDEVRLTKTRRIITILAGPAASFLLCWASTLVHVQNILPHHLAQMLFFSNLSILILNLLPVLPLDGGRILALILESLFSSQRAVRGMKLISITAGVGMILLNILYSWKHGGWNLSLAFAGCCIVYSASMYSITRTMYELRAFMDRKIELERKGSMKTIWLTVLHTTSVRHVVSKLKPGKLMMFICTELGTGRIIGRVHEFDLVQFYLSHPASTMLDVIRQQNLQFTFSNSDTI